MTASIPADMKRLLDQSDSDWHVEIGARHYKVFVDGRFITILPKSTHARRSVWRSHMNALAHIKRAIKLKREQS